MNLSVLLDSILGKMDANAPQKSLLHCCTLLNQHVKNFDWVGFYVMNPSDKHLYLGPFVGKETDHTIIPFGKGICGQVAVSGETYVTDDVHAEDNYIACSLDVKSEIVVPVYFQNQLLAQLDIDSHKSAVFTKEKEEFLNELCSRIGEIMGMELAYSNFFAK